MTKTENTKKNFALIMAVYLFGIFMGALDTGIVTPARTVIQNNLLVDEKTGIWMITIYTLAYAASIPIMGKLADKYGRKYIYLFSIFLFGAGSLFCGLSQNFGSFTLLLIARVIQAIGGGGILPVATAEFGTTFPAEKRGMALGLVGGVYGIANIFGASAGSAILDLFGANNWQFIFYINVPITIFILIAGFISLPNTKEKNIKKTDISGIFILTVMVLSLMYGLKNIDFFNFKETMSSTDVYPFLIIFFALVPIFIFTEKKAADPVLNLDYFKNSRTLITLILSFITGVVIMGMIFVPQFSENAMKIVSGKGGYFVIILGVFAGIGAPLSGKFIDKFGVRIVLGFGFFISIAGALFLILIAAVNPNTLTVITSLILMGTGIGFTMGTPLNYMMLDNTKKEESNSAMAAVSLVRSMGTVIAPAIMIAFLANAGASVQDNIMNVLPKQIIMPPLPYAQELNDEFNELKSDKNFKDKFAGIDIPDLTKQTVEINFSDDDSKVVIPAELIEMMKTSDVTTITKNTETFADRMFDIMSADIMLDIYSGIDEGIDGINGGIKDMDRTIAEMQSGYDGIGKGIQGMQAAISGQKTAVSQLEGVYSMITSSLPPDFPTNTPINLLDYIPPYVLSSMPDDVINQLSEIGSIDELKETIDGLKNSINSLEAKVSENEKSRAGMLSGINSIKSARSEMKDTVLKMTELKKAVPSAFDTAKENYIKEIDKKGPQIESVFQSTLNEGFKQVYLVVAIACAIALIIFAFYKKRNIEENQI